MRLDDANEHQKSSRGYVDIRRWKDAGDAALIEPAQGNRSRPVNFAQKKGGDQESADGEKDMHPQPTISKKQVRGNQPSWNMPGAYDVQHNYTQN